LQERKLPRRYAEQDVVGKPEQLSKEGCSFLKKRTKKLLSVRGAPNFPFDCGATGNEQKFFASFFQKRRPS
jgi:hypothetical protein